LLLRWPRALASLGYVPTLLPSSCALCGELARVPSACLHATLRGPRRSALSLLRQPARPQNRRASLRRLPRRRRRLRRHGRAVDYAAPLDGLVLGLKFGARLPLAPWFGLLRDAVLAQPGWPLPDLLCPVPLGPRRLRERGFNQALEIARPLASALGIALQPRLATRAVETAAQSGVTPRERAATSAAPSRSRRIWQREYKAATSASSTTS
jgi:predicted amidophosphoribosyltransferase